MTNTAFIVTGHLSSFLAIGFWCCLFHQVKTEPRKLKSNKSNECRQSKETIRGVECTTLALEGNVISLPWFSSLCYDDSDII